MQTESIYFRRKWIMYKPADQYDGSRVVESPVLVTIWPDFHPTKESYDNTVRAFYRGKLIDWSEAWEEINVNPDLDLKKEKPKFTRDRFLALTKLLESQLFGEDDED